MGGRAELRVQPRVETFEVSGRRLSYEEWGAGDQPVVLLHGLLLDARINRGVARMLAGRGHRVILLDLLGHGESDKPAHAAEYRMDTYAAQVVGLLDHLGLEEAVVGGVSLGANVTLHLAVLHPERVRAMLIEMPVLERAVPAAALTFVPALVGVHYALPLARLVTRVARLVRRTGSDLIDGALSPFVLPPETATAILHGILVGPVAPTIDARRTIRVPALVVGHGADLIHPFSDAEHLVEQLPDARLVRASNVLELRLRPHRLLDEIDGFLTEVWAPGRPAPAGVPDIGRTVQDAV
jgi:pimeloyl-ACP methyl ester carboxylesterase